MLNESWKRQKTCADDADIDFEDAMSVMSAMLMKPQNPVR